MVVLSALVRLHQLLHHMVVSFCYSQLLFKGFLGIRPHETKMTKSVLQVNQRQGSPNLSPNAQQHNPLRASKESNFYFCAQQAQQQQPQPKEKKKSTNFFKELTNSLYEGGGAVHP